MNLAAEALRRQFDIRNKVDQLIKQALGNTLPGLEVLRSRDHPMDSGDHLVNIFFIEGDVDQDIGRQTDRGRLVVRLASRNGVGRGGVASAVDDELTSLGAQMLDVLAEGENLGGLVKNFVLNRWEYGEPEGSVYTYLALVFAVDYETEED
ncbi:MAG: hypothetical protein OIF55_14670 [Amphritea sp.]|nr:hypothetical protein [Amphritea sp.]